MCWFSGCLKIACPKILNFDFLKHGVLLPARHHGLFLPLLALTAALAVELLLANSLAMQPLAAVLLVASAVDRQQCCPRRRCIQWQGGGIGGHQQAAAAGIG